jgi:uncharacterized MAPEG superfamily protein
MRDSPSSPESFKLTECFAVIVVNMNASALVVYCVSLVVLWLKFFVATVIQARERLFASTFRYPEDAAHFGGQLAPDSDRCARAQSLLRNDAEGQTYFLILGLLYLLVGAWPAGALFYFPAYVLSRVAHAYYLLHPRQPHRTRAFAVGVLIVTLLAVHVAYAAFACARSGELPGASLCPTVLAAEAQ